MSIVLELNYYHGEEANQYSFYRIPKALFTDEYFRGLSAEAKILYGLMLDRMGLSTRNGWLDEAGRVYIYFTLEDAMDMMGFGHNKVVRLFRELDEIGLIERKKQGQGKPTMIYVKNFVLPQEPEQPAAELVPVCADETSESGKSEPHDDKESDEKAAAGEAQTSQNRNSAFPESGGLDFLKEAGNKNNKNKTEKSDTEYPIHPSVPLRKRGQRMFGNEPMRSIGYYREQLKENVDYVLLCMDHPHDKERIDGYIELMAEVCCSGKSTARINQEDMPVELARERFLSLDREHILYVLECMEKTTSRIGNIRAYTLSALYNAPVTMSQYYDALAGHDLAAG